MNSWNLGFDVKTPYVWVDSTGKYWVASYTNTIGTVGLACYSPERSLLWTKNTGDDVNNASLVGLKSFFLQAESTANEVILNTQVGGTSRSFIYNLDGSRKSFNPSGPFVLPLPDGKYMGVLTVALGVPGKRCDSSGVYSGNPEDILTLEGENQDIYTAGFAYGKMFVLSRGYNTTPQYASTLHTFDWNADFSEPKTNYVASRGLDNAMEDMVAMVVRKTTGFWVTSESNGGTFALKYIGFKSSVERNLPYSAMTGFGAFFVNRGVTDGSGMIYGTSNQGTTKGIYHINPAGNGSVIRRFFAPGYDSSYVGIAFDGYGHLWAARYNASDTAAAPEDTIDVFDVSGTTAKHLYSFHSGIQRQTELYQDPWDRIWVYSRVVAAPPRVFDSRGNFLFEFNPAEVPDFGTRPIFGIAVDKAGNIYPAIQNEGVYIINPLGELSKFHPEPNVSAIALDNTGNIWIMRRLLQDIQVLEAGSLRALHTFSGITTTPSLLNFVRPTNSRPKQEVFLTQSNITKIKALDSSLALSSEFGEYGTDLAWRMRVPLGVASVGDLLFTVDRDNRKVHVSTPTGLYLRDFGSGVLKSPRDIEVDEVTGRAFVLDKCTDGTMDIEVFDADGRYMENGLPWKGYREANPDTTKYKLSNDVQGLGYYGAYGRKSRLVVADTGNSRTVIYDGLGYYIHSITGLNRPIDAAVNPANLQVFVLEEGTSSVKVYNIIGQTHSLVRTIGSPGTADGKFDRPKKIAVANGSLYVADYNRIQRFNASTGTFVGSYRLGTGDAHVGGLAVKKTPKAYLYAADYDRKRVIAYDAWGNFVTEFLVKKESGETPLGEALSPRAVAVDQDGNVFVADTLNFVRKYKPDGTFMTKFGGTGTTNGKLSNVYDMHIHDLSLYISERGNNRIQKFDTSGNFQLIMATNGSQAGFVSNPGGIAVDPQDGKVWVADTGNHRLLLFDSTGTFAKVVGIRGSGIPVTTPGGEEPETEIIPETEEGSDPEPIIFDPLDVTGEIEVESPLSVAVTGQSMLVMDTGNGRVQQTTNDGVFQAVLTSSLPTGILSAKAGADERIFAAWNTDRIVAVFRAGSSSVLRIGESGSGRGQLDNPVAVSVAPVYREYVPGKVYAAGSDMKIRVYDDEMNYLFSFGGKSYGVGELINPWDIIERADNGNVHIIDDSRFYTFSSTGGLLNTVSNVLGSYHHLCYESDGHIYLSYFPLYSPASSPANMRPVFRVNSDGSLTEVPFVSSPVMMDSNGHRWIRRTSQTETDGLVTGDIVFSKFSGNTPVFHITYSGISYESTSHINRQINLYGDIYAHGNLSFVVFLYPWTTEMPRYDLDGNYIDRRIAPGRWGSYVTGSFKRNRSGELLTTMVSSSQNMRVFSSTMSTFTDVDFSKLPLIYRKNVRWRGMGGWKNGTKIFIVSAGTKKAYSFTSGASTLLAEYGYYNASTTNSSAVTDIRTDSTGVYVFDMGNGNIRKYDFYGNFLWQWGDASNETGQFNSLDHTRSISMDATYLYVGDFYNRRLYVVRKSDGVHYKTLTTPVLINSVATDGAGKIIHGVYDYADVSTSPVYYKGTLSGTTMTAGPSDATYYATQRQDKKAYSGIGRNHAHFVDGKFLLMAELGWLYVYNTEDGYVGRKQVGGSIHKDLRIYTQKNELWSLDCGASQIKVYDKASFFASATPTVKRTIKMGLAIRTFDIVP